MTHSNKPVHILLVDDDEEDQLLFSEAIKSLGENIVCSFAVNGEKALELLEQTTALPHVIFLDLNMPCMDGKKCLKELKKAKKLKNIPVVIYTTSKSEADVEETRQLGAVGFVVKPNSFSLIKKELARTLEQFGILNKPIMPPIKRSIG